MKNPLSHRLIGNLCMLICVLVGQKKLNAQNWEYFQDPVKLPKYVPAVRADAGGNLWYSSGSILGKTNGIDLQAHDFQAAGIQVLYNSCKSIAPAPDGSIWCGTTNRVLHYEPFTDSWTLYNPFTPPNSGNGYGITVDPDGQVFWASGGWHQWDGTSWVRHYYSFPSPLGNDIEANSTRQILIDPSGGLWTITSGSIGIDNGFITPAGIIYNNQVDTVVYKMSDLGYPNLISLVATQNTQGYPMFLVAAYDPNGQNRRFRLISYAFGSWKNLGDSPPSQASVNEIFQDVVGNVWMACNIGFDQPLVMRRSPDGSWTNYPLDTFQMTYLYSITGTPSGDVWVGGRFGSVGALAKLPVAPISATQDIRGLCPPVTAFVRENQLQLLQVPLDGTTRVRVFDIQGRPVAKETFDQSAPVFNTSQWPRGVYFVQVLTGGLCPAQTIKVVVD